MARMNGDAGAVPRVAKILEELSVEDRRDVVAFLAEDETGSAPAKARAAHRICGALDDLDVAARARVMRFFESQLAPAPVSEGAERA